MTAGEAAGKSHDSVLAERHGKVLLLTFNRPARLNAWSEDLEDRYFDLLEDADNDPTVRAIVVTGAGRGFCSGALMSDLESTSATGVDAEAASHRRSRNLPMRVRKPMIAAINGAAVGLGLVQALYCDLRFTVPEAKLSTIFARRGLIAEYGLSWLLPRVIGYGRAADLLLSGRIVHGTEAAQVGLVNRVVQSGSVVDEALSYATELATYSSPRSMAVIKAQLQHDLDVTFAESIELADRLLIESFAQEDVSEGVASYVERRRPEFKPLPGRSTT